ncbi:MAG: thiamine phosphate synthase [Pyrinomonadaceae bacterium]
MNFRFEKPIIYLITTGEATDANFFAAQSKILDIVHIAVEEKVSLIQIREKRLSARMLFELTISVAEITRRSETRLVVNDRADIALAAKADGVHLAANSLPVDVVRRNFTKDFIIGASTHTADAAEKAARDGADFVVFGPVFKTPGKGEPVGLEALSEVCEKLNPLPVIGLGGIDGTRKQSVLDAGGAGFAAIRYLNDPEKLRDIAP